MITADIVLCEDTQEGLHIAMFVGIDEQSKVLTSIYAGSNNGAEKFCKGTKEYDFLLAKLVASCNMRIQFRDNTSENNIEKTWYGHIWGWCGNIVTVVANDNRNTILSSDNINLIGHLKQLGIFEREKGTIDETLSTVLPESINDILPEMKKLFDETVELKNEYKEQIKELVEVAFNEVKEAIGKVFKYTDGKVAVSEKYKDMALSELKKQIETEGCGIKWNKI